MARTFKERMEATPEAVERGKEFRQRVAEANGDVSRCADLMAEAIKMHREQRGLEVVGRDGRVLVTIETLEADYCLDAARGAYLEARGSNSA